MAWLTPAAACLLLVLTGCRAAPTAHIPDSVDVYRVGQSQHELLETRADRLLIRPVHTHSRVSNADASSRPRR
jgi:hypothetical protein